MKICTSLFSNCSHDSSYSNRQQSVYSQWRLLPSVSVGISIDLNLSFVHYFTRLHWLISCPSCKSQASAYVVVLLKQYHSIWIFHVWGALLPVSEHNIYTLIHEGNAGRGSILWSVVARATLTAKPAHLHVHTASTCNVECGVFYCGPRLPVLRKMSG